MKKYLTGVALAVLATSSFSGVIVDRIIAKKTINIGARANAVPYAYQNANSSFVGYSQDIAMEVVKAFEQKYKVALTVSKQEVTPQTRVILVTSGTIDIEAGSTVATPDKTKVVNFSITDADQIKAATLATEKVTLKSLEDLKGKRVAVVLGTTADQLFKKMNAEQGWNISLVTAKDYPAAFKLLADGRVFAVSTNSVLLAGEMSKLKPEFALQKEISSPDYDMIGLMYSKEDPEFTDLIQSTVARMKADGTLQKLHDKWFTKPIPAAGNLNLDWTPTVKKLVFDAK